MGKRHIFAYNAGHSDALKDAAGPDRHLQGRDFLPRTEA